MDLSQTSMAVQCAGRNPAESEAVPIGIAELMREGGDERVPGQHTVQCTDPLVHWMHADRRRQRACMWASWHILFAPLGSIAQYTASSSNDGHEAMHACTHVCMAYCLFFDRARDHVHGCMCACGVPYCFFFSDEARFFSLLLTATASSYCYLLLLLL